MCKDSNSLVRSSLDPISPVSFYPLLNPQDLTEIKDSKVIIDGGRYSSPLDEQGHFHFDLPSGSFVLQVLSTTFAFDRIRLDVSNDEIIATLTLPGTSWSKVGPRMRVPLELTPRSRYVHDVPPPSFSILGLLMNPMILMSVIPLGLLLLLPKLTEGLDPEALKEIQQQRAAQPQAALEMPDVSQKLANFFSPSTEGNNPSSSAQEKTVKKRK